jgi:hypothetical protein
MKLTPKFVACLVAALVCASVAPAGAELAPTKPSQLVTLHSGSTPCGSSSNGIAIDSVGNGTTLTIAPKEVLVITDVEVIEFLSGPNTTSFVAFDLLPENRNYLSMIITSGPASSAYGERSLQHGIVVKPGDTICSYQPDALWTLHGYFTKDK